MHGENRSEEFREMVGASPEGGRGDPAADNRKNRQHNQRAKHAPRRFVDVNMMFVVTLLAVKSEVYQAEHITRGKQSSEQADTVKNVAAGIMAVAHGESAEEDRVLGEESRERREAGDGNGGGLTGP